jgi:hypothetical protein
VNSFVQYSSLPIGLVKASIAAFFLCLIDDIIFYKINTIQAIKEKNSAYAIILLGYAIVVAACMFS